MWSLPGRTPPIEESCISTIRAVRWSFVSTRSRIAMIVGWAALAFATVGAIAGAVSPTASLGGTRLWVGLSPLVAVSWAFVVGHHTATGWGGASRSDQKSDPADDPAAVEDDGLPPSR
jgi:hypothetical protein